MIFFPFQADAQLEAKQFPFTAWREREKLKPRLANQIREIKFFKLLREEQHFITKYL
jgi:hypothetical protein